MKLFKSAKQFASEWIKFSKRWNINGAIICFQDGARCFSNNKVTTLELIDAAKTEEMYIEMVRHKNAENWLNIGKEKGSKKDATQNYVG